MCILNQGDEGITAITNSLGSVAIVILNHVRIIMLKEGEGGQRPVTGAGVLNG